MLTLPALRIQQFNQDLYMLNVSAADVERMIKFEVLGEAGLQGAKRKSTKSSTVNWEEIEKKVSTSEKAFQRPILRKKIEELAAHYLQCRDDGAVPAIPGAVLLSTDEKVGFAPSGGNPFVGLISMNEVDGALRVIDGQHRLLALASLLNAPDLTDAERAQIRLVQVPAILFAGLPPPSIVEMFVTINSKHTRLNSSLLYTLKGRQLYPDPVDAKIHDALNALNGKDGGPLGGHIRMLGVGAGKVAQAGLAHEMAALIRQLKSAHGEAIDEFVAHLDKFFPVYFEEVAEVFSKAWTSKSHSTRSGIALRAFIQAAQPIVSTLLEQGGAPRALIRAMIANWETAIGAARFETGGLWRTRAAGGGKETTRVLARELVAALSTGGRK